VATLVVIWDKREGVIESQGAGVGKEACACVRKGVLVAHAQSGRACGAPRRSGSTGSISVVYSIYRTSKKRK
jgi:hypothetical protein